MKCISDDAIITVMLLEYALLQTILQHNVLQ